MAFILLIAFVFWGRCAGAQDAQSVLGLGRVSGAFVEWPSEAKRVRETFPLRDEVMRSLLSKALAEELLPANQRGLEAVVRAHGALGFLWAIGELAREDTFRVRYNLCAVLRCFRYREAYVFYISLLDDKRFCPPPSLEYIKSLGPTPESSRIRRTLEAPMRICDHAFDQINSALGGRHEIPQEMRADIYVGTPIVERDSLIAQTEDWWHKEGERLITAKHPSVVEVLLKEAEERSKQEEKAKAGAEQKAPQPPAPKAQEPDQKPKAP